MQTKAPQLLKKYRKDNSAQLIPLASEGSTYLQPKRGHFVHIATIWWDINGLLRKKWRNQRVETILEMTSLKLNKMITKSFRWLVKQKKEKKNNNLMLKRRRKASLYARLATKANITHKTKRKDQRTK